MDKLQPETVSIIAAESIKGLVIAQRYQLGEIIGQGSWSTVYSAWHQRLGQAIAVKCLHSHLVSTSDKLKRFQIEAEISGKLNHANIVKVFDFGCLDDGSPFLVMDLVPGVPLSVVSNQEGKLAPDRCARIARQIAEGLNYAHEHGAIHRDIKPANIMVHTTNQSEDQVRIVDFGIAKAVITEGKPEFTQTGDIVGTPQYMSPEQCLGGQVNGKSDVYSLGCVMYQMLKGEPPFQGRNTFDCMRKHFNSAPPPIFVDGSEAERTIEAIVLACLRKEDYRRPDARQVANLLTMYLDGNFAQTKQSLSQITAAKPVSKPAGQPYLKPVLIAATIATLVFIAGISMRFINAATVMPSSTNHNSKAIQLELPPKDLDLAASLLTSANSNLLCQQPDFNGSESHVNMLNTVFMDIELGLAQLSADGNNKEMVEVKDTFNSLKNKVLKRESLTPRSPLHVISIAQAEGQRDDRTAETKVIVTAKEPVVLMLRSLEKMNWKIELGPQAKLTRVYLVAPKKKVQQIAGIPANIPITTTSVDDWWEGEIRPHTSGEFNLFQKAHKLTGLDVATYQSNHFHFFSY